MAKDKSPEQSGEPLSMRLLKQGKNALEDENRSLALTYFCEALLLDPDIDIDIFDIQMYARELASHGEFMQTAPIALFLQAYHGWGEPIVDSVLTANVFFWHGKQLIDSGEDELGAQLWVKAAETDPGDYEWMESGAQILVAEGLYEEAAKILEIALEETYFDEESGIELLAWAQHKSGRTAEALETLLAWLYNYSSDRLPRLYLYLVRSLDDEAVLDAIQKLDEKLRELLDEELIFANVQEFLFDAWWILINRSLQKASNEAIAYISRAVEKVEMSSWAKVFAYGWLFLNLGDFDKAVELSNETMEIVPNHPLPFLMKAKAFLAKKEFKQALESAESGLAMIEQQNAYAVEPDDVLQNLRGQPHEKTTIHWRTQDPHPELLLAKIDALTGLQRYDEALNVLGSALQSHPKILIFYRYAATLNYKLGNTELAYAYLQKARKEKLKFDKPTRELNQKVKKLLSGLKTNSIPPSAS